jgi:phage shock protein PspC (stress-responsive transcriptional regulator)
MAATTGASDDRDMSETTTTQMPTGGADAGPKRLVRTPDGKIAGVAAGIGHYLGVDPTIVRIAFVLLAFAGGIGVLLYLACWLVMPKGEIPAGGDARGVDPWTLGALGALVLGVGLLFGWHGLGDGVQVVAGLALVGVGVWLLVRDRPPAAGPAPGATPTAPGPPVPPAPGGQVPAARRPGAVEAPEADGEAGTGLAPGAEPSAPDRRRGLVTAGVLSLLSIGAAVVIAGVLSGWFDASVSVVLAAALVVVGAGLVLASVVGRAPWLFVIGGLLTSALLVTAAIEPLVDDGVGERTVAPVSLAELESRYAYGIGEYTVDLRDVALDGTTRRLEVELGIGSLEVILPETGAVAVDAHVRGGQIRLPDGRTADGWDESARYVDGPVTEGALVIDLELGFGDAEVRRG